MFTKRRALITIFIVLMLLVTSVSQAAALYKLPYLGGDSAKMTNGPGQGEHTQSYNRYAYDFKMPVGAVIVAARAGKVTKVIENYGTGGCSRTYKDKANLVVIRHSDGTRATYVHLQKNDVIVEVGQEVAQGQPIARAGKSGFVCVSSGAILHFAVTNSSNVSVQISFADVTGGKPQKNVTYVSGNYFNEVPPFVQKVVAPGKPLPLYRFYNLVHQAHFYTTSADEANNLRTNPDWKYEGVGFEVYQYDYANQLCVPGQSAVYRFYSPVHNSHFYTADEWERDHLIANDPNWTYENPVFCVYQTKVTGTAPVFRFFNVGLNHHFYTISVTEKNAVSNNPNWTLERTAFFAKP